MSFASGSRLVPYVPRPSPKLDQSKETHIERELDNIKNSIASIMNAIRELQEYLENNP